MSRRHKVYPTISTQEIHNIAEETSKDAISKAGAYVSSLQAMVIRNCRKHDTCSSEKILDIIHSAISKSVEDKLITEFGKYVNIIDNPTSDIIFDKRGAPTIDRLFERFKDCDVITMLRTIYENVYHEAIHQATDLLEHAMCFLLAMSQMENESIDRKLQHYYDLLCMYIKGAKLKNLRTLQSNVKKIMGLKKKILNPGTIWGDVKRKLHETSLYKKWKGWIDMYYEQLLSIAPVYAQY